MKLTDYVFDYLKKRFDRTTVAKEIRDNLEDACVRYRHNYEINLFWHILTGQIDENVYHHEMREYARLLQFFLGLSSPSRTQVERFHLSWPEFTAGLRQLYPNRTKEQITMLTRSAERELRRSSDSSDGLDFLQLFMEDDEGRVGEFLQAVREQRQLDRYDYVERIKDVLVGHP